MPSEDGLQASEIKTEYTVPGGLASDLTAFSKEELAVMNRVLIAILHARNFDGLLQEMYAALNRLCRLDGCALYSMSENKLGLRLAYGAGEYKSFLPDVIPQGSDLFKCVMAKWMMTRNFAIMPPSKMDQPSLFDDHPLSLFCPIVVDDNLLGALVAVHSPDSTDFLRVIFNEAAMALELLYKADAANGVYSTGSRLNMNAKVRDGSFGDTQPKLTTREKEVLRLLAEGLSNKEIADKLFISPATCKHHVENILAKLQVRSRAAAVAVGLTYIDKAAVGR